MDDLFPVGMNENFRIGSATKWGGKVVYGSERSADYLFPGKDIIVDSADGGRVTVHLATVFASGLARLLLCTTITTLLLVNDKENSKRTSETRLNEAKGQEDMTKIFNLMSNTPGATRRANLSIGLGKNLFPADPNAERNKIKVLWEF
ncbi:hypothetical protein MMC11_009020, partial [Xylographa trunciseda]|nr:hypothetical protein [Xylographa trunciseda]